jgi:hypothetical protein
MEGDYIQNLRLVVNDDPQVQWQLNGQTIVPLKLWQPFI